MATGQIVTREGHLIAMNRTFKSVPDYTTPSLFRIGTGTAIPLSTDIVATMAANQLAFNGGGFTKSFVTGYPVFDETNNVSTIRCFISTLDGNGGGSSNLSEFGISNSDGAPKLFSRATFTAITKDNTVQVYIVDKDKVV